ncbi:MAG: PmeII family type II restriction endonuclease [Anaerolineae bacterium]
MNQVDLNLVCSYVNENIVYFHEQRIRSLNTLSLAKLLTKNPYLFKAKHIKSATELVPSFLEAFLSSSEEKLFGDFLEGLAIFIAGCTCGGHKSAATGVDLEFMNQGIHYIVSIKSGPSWGNAAQQNKLEQDLKNAVAKVKQAKHGINVQPVLGICYGKTKSSYIRNYYKVVGQSFWYLISENPNLYTDIIEPIGYRAKEHNETFTIEKEKVINRFTRELFLDFCDTNGAIDWIKLVEYNSGNYEPDSTQP